MAELDTSRLRARARTVPKREAAGSFRDPARAFLYQGSWYVGVGCGQSVHDPANGGGAVCLFRATNDSLAEFTDVGSLYRTNHSTGSFGRHVRVFNRSQDVKFDMLECPDVFYVNGTWVLLASIAHVGGANQWFTGAVKGIPPRFVPRRVGVLDYGNLYAAKTGSTLAQTGHSRRVMFGFTGWGQNAEGGGRYLVLPRDLMVDSDGVHIHPVPETKTLRVKGSAKRSTTVAGSGAQKAVAGQGLSTGAQLEVHIACNQTETGAWPANGTVALRTLASADGKHYTTVGWDFSDTAAPFFVDHTHCCKNKSDIIQRALATAPRPGHLLEMWVWVDSGMIEAFSSGVAITALVYPTVDAGGLPEERRSAVINTADGVICEASSYRLALNGST